MEKSMTLNLRISPDVKQKAEDILRQLGIPMATAVDMYLRQITLTGGIPFPVSLPSTPTNINADKMTVEQLRAELLAGLDDARNGSIHPAAEAFAEFREAHR